jgi:hypothetical protein
MRHNAEARLAVLKSEYEKGQNQLRQLESQSHGLRETLLRISGAITVLEELLSAPALEADGRLLNAPAAASDRGSSAAAEHDVSTANKDG